MNRVLNKFIFINLFYCGFFKLSKSDCIFANIECKFMLSDCNDDIVECKFVLSDCKSIALTINA